MEKEIIFKLTTADGHKVSKIINSLDKLNYYNSTIPKLPLNTKTIDPINAELEVISAQTSHVITEPDPGINRPLDTIFILPEEKIKTRFPGGTTVNVTHIPSSTNETDKSTKPTGARIDPFKSNTPIGLAYKPTIGYMTGVPINRPTALQPKKPITSETTTPTPPTKSLSLSDLAIESLSKKSLEFLVQTMRKGPNKELVDDLADSDRIKIPPRIAFEKFLGEDLVRPGAKIPRRIKLFGVTVTGTKTGDDEMLFNFPNKDADKQDRHPGAELTITIRTDDILFSTESGLFLDYNRTSGTAEVLCNGKITYVDDHGASQSLKEGEMQQTSMEPYIDTLLDLIKYANKPKK